MVAPGAKAGKPLNGRKIAHTLNVFSTFPEVHPFCSIQTIAEYWYVAGSNRLSPGSGEELFPEPECGGKAF